MFNDVLQNFMAQISHDIQNTELVKAALYASTIGSLLYLVKALPLRFVAWLRRVTLCSVTVSNNDAAYAWLQLFLAKEKLGQRARRLVVSTNNYVEHDHDDYDDEVKNKPGSAIAYKPDAGTYLIRYKGYPLLLETSRERIEQRNEYSETITVTSVFRRGLLLELLSEAASFAKEREKKTITLYTASGQYWANAGERPFRSLASLVYAENIGATLLGDAQKFLSEKDWYQGMGIPWRRGYLLYGPPGNGKTSLAFALASELKFDVYILNLAGGIGDESVQNLMGRVPEGSIVLLEEVDEVFNGTKKRSGVSHTGLLNALDGISSHEGRIVMMTTNYKERISSALIRPGRADVHLYVGNASHMQIQNMFERFYPESALAEQFATSIAMLGQEVSMAALQNHLLTYRGNPALTVEMVSVSLVRKEAEKV
ncbi:MAG: AAA family ATPase [Trueperaceae bacterium]